MIWAGERFRRLQLAADFDNAQMARELGVSKRAVENWRAGIREPWPQHAERLVELTAVVMERKRHGE